MARCSALFLLALVACSSAVNAASLFDNLGKLTSEVAADFEDFVSHFPKFEPTKPYEGRRLLTNSTMGSVQTFLSNVLGGNWTQYLPHNWALPSFDWNTLGAFEYTSNLADFMDGAHNFTKPTSLADLHAVVADVEAHFCKNETFIASKKVPASCTGPSVTLAYVPKVCVLDSEAKAVVCDPAKLVLVKTPGSCVHAYHSASKWVGKECKIGGSVGFAKATEKGGGAYNIPLKTVSFDLTP